MIPLRAILIASTGALVATLAWSASEQTFATRRQELVAHITAMTRATAAETGRRTVAPKVMAAIGRVPRHRFVPVELQGHAYENRPLPIGHGQTISQPYIVALMTDLLQAERGHRVLEVGTGSGYQAAVLAELTTSVHSIEIIAPLAEEARARLDALACRNIELRIGDGYYGWPERAPFDGIVVTAVASHIPPPLVRQLRPGGRMVIPVGAQFMVQHLMLVEKHADGGITSRQIIPVSFVPLTGEH